MPKLQTISIGSCNMRYVKNFLLNGFESLQSISIDYYSFNIASLGDCIISNCPFLTSIYFDDEVFYSYKYFVLQNVPSLQSITLVSHNFYSSNLFDINRISLYIVLMNYRFT